MMRKIVLELPKLEAERVTLILWTFTQDGGCISHSFNNNFGCDTFFVKARSSISWT